MSLPLLVKRGCPVVEERKILPSLLLATPSFNSRARAIPKSVVNLFLRERRSLATFVLPSSIALLIRLSRLPTLCSISFILPALLFLAFLIIAASRLLNLGLGVLLFLDFPGISSLL